MEKSTQSIVEEIFLLFEKYGAREYIGEPVSQIEHACQTAQLAEKEGFDEEVILAALFHDLGHLYAFETSFEDMDGYGAKRHEQIGAKLLRNRGFSEKIATLVENHVQAKRYLTYKFPEYYAGLSEASKKTLEFQGGVMTEEEAILFEMDDLSTLSVKMRTWDELAKDTNIPLPEMSHYKDMVIRHLEKTTS